MENKNLILPYGEILSEDLQNKIKQINSGKPDFPTYSRRVRQLFNLEKVTINEAKSYFLAGFIEGEGSISISLKQNYNAKFGIELDPLFNITQHVNGVKHLYLALELFQTGRIRFKAKSNATLVFVVEPRKSLQQKVCPYFEKYVYPLSSPAKQLRYKNFKKILDLFDNKAHLDREKVINELLPIWDSMRIHTNFVNSSFKSLEEAQEFVKNYSVVSPGK